MNDINPLFGITSGKTSAPSVEVDDLLELVRVFASETDRYRDSHQDALDSLTAGIERLGSELAAARGEADELREDYKRVFDAGLEHKKARETFAAEATQLRAERDFMKGQKSAITMDRDLIRADRDKARTELVAYKERNAALEAEIEIYKGDSYGC
jgi:chromosome segregation ATPase